MNFKQWLNEVGTSTSSVAVFSMPVGGIVSRTYPDEITFKQKKKKKKHEQYTPMADPKKDGFINNNEKMPSDMQWLGRIRDEFSLEQYTGKNIGLFAQALEDYRENPLNSKLQDAIIKAINGDDSVLKKLY